MRASRMDPGSLLGQWFATVCGKSSSAKTAYFTPETERSLPPSLQIGVRTYRGGQTRMDTRAAHTQRCSGAVPQTALTATPRTPTHSGKIQTMRAALHALLHASMTML